MLGEIVIEEQKCRVCGCTWNNACEGSCYWVEEDLCSKCYFSKQEQESALALDEDSICYGCKYFEGGEDGCNPPGICIEGSMNGYQIEG